MWMRNYQGKIVYFDITKYHNEKDLYCALWKTKFNIDVEQKDMDFNREIMSIIIS
jgi:hypothetical protein|uniref:Uncharacterized protein n=1 Tax=viral metagenome TaxID=1070528 RepID=A0A6C0C6K6_9ZZZZ